MSKVLSAVFKGYSAPAISECSGIYLELANLKQEDMLLLVGALSTPQLDALSDALRGTQLELTVHGIERGEILIRMADEARMVASVAHRGAMCASRKTRKAVNKGFFHRLAGLITGSSRAVINESIATARVELERAITAERKFLGFYRADAQVSLRISEVQSRLFLLDRFVSEELRRERSILYRVKKMIRRLSRAPEVASIRQRLPSPVHS